MMDIKAIRPRYTNTINMTIQFPIDAKELEAYFDKKVTKCTGEKIDLVSFTDEYITGDEIKLIFAARHAGLRLTEISDAQKNEFIKMSPAPTVGKALTKKEAAQFKEEDPNEKRIIENLIKLKYLPDTKPAILIVKKEDGTILELNEKNMAERLKELGYIVYPAKNVMKANAEKKGKSKGKK